ncbi:RNA polymerase subunit sigma-24 [Paenibacillus alvei]|uniref:hypothetical protein n=2 Tax=Paenibacillus alvei TaxID=44250 RepID=UPI000288B388|nr:hypothetical protein [Paenibacillus alvei]EJW16984.1 RNA polymerase, sigma-24 subunit, ECF subfamily [Paenibacillus alvei DSM 29]MCY9539097.1 RNA polymerase subunit sigma-24 [Paenibacillus alvei]MCY9707978.1 RNA polymerase subunit sigma-24 [Paenibacillus alvei]MCY9734427.1 RNA polymerase subunit sigma-24 [Paenibacillus alvei]MEC0078753.1 RNA polymerase subunit sigma-24 [Paenibacillus alvei]
MILKAKMTEQHALDQLLAYKRLLTRIRVIETYPVTGGILLKTIASDDRLQELHSKLKGLPSYMYLTKHEQRLEQTAHAYLSRYPVGTRAQLNEVRSCKGADAEDEKLLKELARKIQNVIDARGGGQVDDFEGVLERISELQELESQKKYFESTLETLGGKYGRILCMQYVEFKEPMDIADEMGVSLPTMYKWRRQALQAYGKLIDGLVPIKM